MTSWVPLCRSRSRGRDESGPQGRLVEIRGTKKRWHDRELVSLFELDGRDIAELAVEAAVVVPADPIGDREVQLLAGAPDAVGDQLGLEGIHDDSAMALTLL